MMQVCPGHAEMSTSMPVPSYGPTTILNHGASVLTPHAALFGVLILSPRHIFIRAFWMHNGIIGA